MNVLCFLGLHSREVTQVISPMTKRFACQRCGAMWVNYLGEKTMVKWTRDHHEFYTASCGIQMIYKPWEKRRYDVP